MAPIDYVFGVYVVITIANATYVITEPSRLSIHIT